MRLVLSVALLSVALLLVPAVAASKLPLTGDKTLGPCRFAYNRDAGDGGFYPWPMYEMVACHAADREVVYVLEGEDWSGNRCAVRVLGTPLYECPP